MARSTVRTIVAAVSAALAFAATAAGAEDWLQFKYDCRHSGNAADRAVQVPLGLAGAVPLTDAAFTAPVVADGKVYVVDGSGVAFCIDAETLRVVWRFRTRGGAGNCNNVSSPAIVGGRLHFGTTGGSYYVLDAADGHVVKEIRCGEPIFASPVAANARAYFATLGARVYAVEADGTVCWQWDYVKDKLGFDGDRWSGADWLRHKKGRRVTWRDTFCCARDAVAFDKTLVVPAGGETVWLEDAGDRARLLAVGAVPKYKGGESPATFGLSAGEGGSVYRQWHRRDNTGRVEIMRLRDGKVTTSFVPGTQTRNDMPGLISFCSVSVRGEQVYRCRPQEGFGLCRHTPGRKEAEPLGGYPSICPPILLRDRCVYGGLDGRLYVVPLAADGKAWSFATAFGKAITAPPAVCDGRVYFACEDGYLYALAPGPKAAPPRKDLELWKVRSPLTGKYAGAEYDWYTSFADLANTNANAQSLRPPLKVKWIRRYAGTFKHLGVCGGGRMYTHTAEGLILAVEQETGRLLWRRYWPGVHVSYTSPLYWKGRLIVPQAGLERSRLRCLDAATGRLIWEVPFTGSPSWSRQQPPVVHENRVIYMFGTGKYAPKGTGIYVMRHGAAKTDGQKREGTVSWLYSHDNPFYPSGHRAIVQAWDFSTGKSLWRRDFSEYGAGGDDAGLCLMDGRLYYSVFFGYAAKRRGRAGPHGLTAELDPATGRTLWQTTEHSVTAGCTISGKDGRLYLGGYNPPHEKTKDRYVWCLNAKDGSLIWRSQAIRGATNNVTIGPEILVTHPYGGPTCVIDRRTGKVRSTLGWRYACTRFGLSMPYLLGANMDLIDVTKDNRLVSTGPPVDGRECVGAFVSNGRVYYTTQASGLQVCQQGRSD